MKRYAKWTVNSYLRLEGGWCLDNVSKCLAVGRHHGTLHKTSLFSSIAVMTQTSRILHWIATFDTKLMVFAAVLYISLHLMNYRPDTVRLIIMLPYGSV